MRGKGRDRGVKPSNQRAKTVTGQATGERRYCIACAAKMVRVPFTTVRAWAIGQPRFEPLIRVDFDGTGEPLSLRNVVELQLIAILRRTREHRGEQWRRKNRKTRQGYINGPDLRRSLRLLSRQPWLSAVEREHPLLVEGLSISGDQRRLVVIREGKTYAVQEPGQMALDIPELFRALKAHVEWDDDRVKPRALFPRTRTAWKADEYPPDLGIPERAIEVRPGYAAGEPALRECGKLARNVLGRLAGGDAPLAIAEDLGCAPSEIQETAWYGQTEGDDPMEVAFG